MTSDNKALIKPGSPVSNPNTLRTLLQTNAEQIQSTLPMRLKIDDIVTMAITAARSDPKIYRCTQLSTIQSVLTACSLGLDFSGKLGEGWLIPFKDTLTFIAGYRGYIKLVRNTGQISVIDAQVVYEDDEFEYELGLSPTLRHKPNLTPPPLKKRIVQGAYATARFIQDGSVQFTYMPLSELEGIRGRSKAKDKGPWVTDTIEMYRKTAIRRLVKYLPMDATLQRLVMHDNATDGLDPAMQVNVNADITTPDDIEPFESRTDQVEDEFKQRNQTRKEPTEDNLMKRKPANSKPPDTEDEGTTAEQQERLDAIKEMMKVSGELSPHLTAEARKQQEAICTRIPDMKTAKEVRAATEELKALPTKEDSGKQGELI